MCTLVERVDSVSQERVYPLEQNVLREVRNQLNLNNKTE